MVGPGRYEDWHVFEGRRAAERARDGYTHSGKHIDAIMTLTQLDIDCMEATLATTRLRRVRERAFTDFNGGKADGP